MVFRTKYCGDRAAEPAEVNNDSDRPGERPRTDDNEFAANRTPRTDHREYAAKVKEVTCDENPSKCFGLVSCQKEQKDGDDCVGPTALESNEMPRHVAFHQLRFCYAALRG